MNQEANGYVRSINWRNFDDMRPTNRRVIATDAIRSESRAYNLQSREQNYHVDSRVRSDKGAHGRSANHVDRDAVLLERAQDAKVRKATCAAAAERDADARAGDVTAETAKVRRRRNCRVILSTKNHKECYQKQQKKNQKKSPIARWKTPR